MEFLRIEAGDKKRWDKVWELYEESFPIVERRKVEDHISACNDERFFPLSVWDGQQLIGLMFFWEWDKYRYLEHLAVNPNLRGHGYGTQLLYYLRESNHTIMLEIDPLINELSVRRLQFYERSGFTLTPYRFVHLPYRLDGIEQELLILSYPKMITKEQHNNFLKFVGEEVIKYCEGYTLEKSS
jgi:ribosomal protein S18 acetylase RimI-like enzyme